MRKLLFFTIIALLTVQSSTLMAQDKEESDVMSYVDWAWNGTFRPYFEFSYGHAQPMQKLFEAELAPIGSYEAKIGYSHISPFKKNILGMDERYLFGSYYNPDINYIDSDPTGVTTEAIRFGFGNRLGYGYDLGAVELLPYNQIQYIWTKFDPVDSTGISKNDQEILDRYAGAYRFGHSGEAGVKLQIAKSFAITGSYEFAVIYPRHIFWPWLGSHIIQDAALGIVSVFSEDIVNASPIFGPIMYFLLKNGVMYAFYQGYRDKMNWPFESETPMTIETFKIGASLTF